MSDIAIPNRKNPKKTGLGRGLESLLGSASFEESDDFEIVETKKTESRQKSEESKPAVKEKIEAEILAQTGANPSSNKKSETVSEVNKEVVNSSRSELSDKNRIWNIAIEKLIPNKEQPRKVFTSDELQELSASIKEKGVLQPILVRKLEDSDQYQVIAGERRWRASQKAGLKDVPVIIKDADTKSVLEMALIENIQRQDLNPVEECEAYQLLSRKYKMTQAEIADRVGKDRATVANLMRLGQLNPQVREFVLKNELPLGQAKVLLSVEDKKDQLELAKKAIRQDLSVRATERLVSAFKAATLKADLDLEEDEEDEIDDRLFRELAAQLQKRLGTRVNIDFNGRKGRMSIDFYSVPELNRIADRIQGSD